MLANRISKAPG